MAPPIVALLSDFGLRDHYVGAMKGAVLTVCPDASLVDISHEIPPQDVFTGALELAASFSYFPPGTIFLVIVDPGVGSERRGIALEAGGYRFVAPDNGVLSLVLDEAPLGRVVELTNQHYARASVSRTFEGRDRFGPAAGWLARGEDLGKLGRPLDAITELTIPRAHVTRNEIEGEVLRVDRFGNLITNIDRGIIETLAASGPPTIQIGSRRIDTLALTYADVPAGQLCALFASTGQLEIATNGGSAAAMLGASRGIAVRVTTSA